jgi:hypothetical protein
MGVGDLVMRVGWTRHPEWQWLARYGRVRRADGERVLVEWQAGNNGKAMTATHARADLALVWWRTTMPELSRMRSVPGLGGDRAWA